MPSQSRDPKHNCLHASLSTAKWILSPKNEKPTVNSNVFYMTQKCNPFLKNEINVNVNTFGKLPSSLGI